MLHLLVVKQRTKDVKSLLQSIDDLIMCSCMPSDIDMLRQHKQQQRVTIVNYVVSTKLPLALMLMTGRVFLFSLPVATNSVMSPGTISK